MRYTDGRQIVSEIYTGCNLLNVRIILRDGRVHGDQYVTSNVPRSLTMTGIVM